MKKIGILTYFSSNNPGTFLQAYSIQESFRKLLPDCSVEIINYRRWRNKPFPNPRVITILQWKRDFHRMYKFHKLRKKHLSISSEGVVTLNYDKALDYIKRQDYDMVVVGSDTVLELCHYPDNTVSIYWLPKELNCIKVMCAPSARGTQYENLSTLQVQKLKDSVSGFSLMGVRDISTKVLLGNLGAREDKLYLLPDPTCTFEIDYSYADKYFLNLKIDKKKPIVAMHLTNSGIEWGKELADRFRKYGYRIFSIAPVTYSDLNINDISPFEWAGYFKYFDFVITSRFHDSMFCLKNAIPFVTVVPQTGNYVTSINDSKYHSLLRSFDLLDNIIDNPSLVRLDDVFNIAINAKESFDKNKISNKMLELKSIFNCFLLNTCNLL